jgi:hypothetical protein
MHHEMPKWLLLAIPAVVSMKKPDVTLSKERVVSQFEHPRGYWSFLAVGALFIKRLFLRGRQLTCIVTGGFTSSEEASLLKMPGVMVEPGLVDSPCASSQCFVSGAIFGP